MGTFWPFIKNKQFNELCNKYAMMDTELKYTWKLYVNTLM